MEKQKSDSDVYTISMNSIYTSHRSKRHGTCTLWAKRNWLLICLISLACSGVISSMLLLFEPCNKTTHTLYTNITRLVNTTAYENKTLLMNNTNLLNTTKNVSTYQNISFVVNETISYNMTYNTSHYIWTNMTHNMTRNVTRNITYDAIYNITYNVTQNVTYNNTYEIVKNITYNVTQNITYNTTFDMFHNISYNTTLNVTYNETYNISVNVSTFYNSTFLTTSRQNYTKQLPVDVMLALDSSYSVDNDAWEAENKAGKELLSNFAKTVHSSLQTGISVWANDGKVRMSLANYSSNIFQKNQIQRLPYCSIVPNPYSSFAKSTSNTYCIDKWGYKENEKWGLTGVYTYYAQALLTCINEFSVHSQNNSYKLCIVVTDGIISEDAFHQCGTHTMIYDSNMTDNFYDAGKYLFIDNDCIRSTHSMWIAPGSYELCMYHGIKPCTVDSISIYMKNVLNISIANILVGTFDKDIQSRMYALSSCNTYNHNYCPYLQTSDNFDDLALAANHIASSIAVDVGTETIVNEASVRVSKKETLIIPKDTLKTKKHTTTISVKETHKETFPETRKQQSLHTHKERHRVVEQNTQKYTRKQTSKKSKKITKHKQDTKHVSIHVPIMTQTTVKQTQENTVRKPKTIQTTRVKQREIVNTEKVKSQEKQEISKHTTVSNKVVETVPVTHSETTQQTFCTGSDSNFAFLILTLPLIIYLCVKPVFNLFESMCYIKTSHSFNRPSSPIIMHKNPMFGKNIDIETSNTPTKRRTPIDKTLHKLPHKKIKKHISSYNESPIHTSHITERSPKRKTSIINNFKRHSDTEWHFHAAAIYDGDDWQEKTSNAIIYMLSCCKQIKH